MENTKIHILIDKYFKGIASDEESITLKKWCEESEENKQEYIYLLMAWKMSDSLFTKKINSSQYSQWKNINEKIQEKKTTTKQQKRKSEKRIFYYSISSAAAIIIILLMLDLFCHKSSIINEKQTKYTTIYMPKGEKGQIRLADGTKVWLNTNSKLRISNQFNTMNRNVILEGEAYFDVAKNKKSKFIVQADRVNVIVYGTAFDVKCYNYLPEIKVSLERGSVKIKKANSNEILATLKPNQQATINKRFYTTQTKEFDTKSTQVWTFNELDFNYTPAKEMFKKIENWYGVDIQLKSVDPNLKYRLKVKSESLKEILELINSITPINYKIQGKEVTVRYNKQKQ